MPTLYSWQAFGGLGGVSQSAITGLDWNGNPSGRRAIVFTTPLAAYPATYIWKVFQRNQVSGVGDLSRYYTTFFHGNNGDFVWGSGYERSYYGAHPYPIPANTGDGKWEISTSASDIVTLDDGTSPYVTNNAWYSQALVVSASGGNLNHKFYIDLPSVGTSKRITYNFAATYAAPPSPCVIWGQAPANNAGTASWGGYSRFEEQNAIIRGVQIYSAALTEAQIVALAAKETDADVLAYCSANGITSLWYLNMNWTLADISDKSGGARHPSWAGSQRPTQYTA